MPMRATEVITMTTKNPIRFKSFVLEGATTFDDATGEVTGYASIFGNIDHAGDVIEHGAYTKTIAESGNKVRFLWQHDRSEPIGSVLELKEDGKGLWFRAKFANTQRAQEARELMSMGAMDSFSIGYVPVLEVRDEVNGRVINRIKEVRLFEISPVTFPCNPEATIASIKSINERTSSLTDEEQNMVLAFMDWLAAERKAQDRINVNVTVEATDLVESLQEVAEALADLSEAEPVTTGDEAPEAVSEDLNGLKALRDALVLKRLAASIRNAHKG